MLPAGASVVPVRVGVRIVGVVGAETVDDGMVEVDQLILTALVRIHQRRQVSAGFALSKPALEMDCITGTIDGDETAVAAGSSHAPHCLRRNRPPPPLLKCLGKGRSRPESFATRRRCHQAYRVRQHGVTLFGALAGTRVNVVSPPWKLALRAQKQYHPWQYIAFCNVSGSRRRRPDTFCLASG